MPNAHGKFVVFSDTSKTACGAALYQEQQNELRLCGYFSKKLFDAASRYSITELELLGLAIVVTGFKHVLKNTDFIAYVDHSSLVNIHKAKTEPPTLRIKKLLETLSEYSFEVRYWKGKDNLVADFLSRNADNDNDSVHDIIPISFQMQDFCYVVTRGMAKAANVKAPEILDTHKRPEHSGQQVLELPKILNQWLNLRYWNL